MKKVAYLCLLQISFKKISTQLSTGRGLSIKTTHQQHHGKQQLPVVHAVIIFSTLTTSFLLHNNEHVE